MRTVLLLAGLGLGSAAGAATLLGAPPAPGQTESGRAIAAGSGGLGQAGACFRCHGFDGAAQDAAAFPALAGQSAEYLHAQLDRYASGARANPIMSPIAAALSEAQRRDVAVFYGSLPPAAAGADAAAPGDAALLQHGAILSAIGSAESGVQACQNCHGPAGIGTWPSYPRLAGQPAAYLALQLRAWQSGERAGDGPQMAMASIARRMSERDIAASALYFASVRPQAAQQVRGVLP